MKSEKKLFDLVQSLNTSEIRYFRKYSKLKTSSITGKKRYLADFEAILKMKSYTPEKWKLNVSKNNSAPKAKASQKYLLNLILEIVSQQNQKETMKLLDMVKQIEFLFHKKLFDQAIAKIKIASSVAESWSQFGILSRIQSIEVMIYSLLKRPFANSEKEKELIKKRKQTANKLINLIQYEHEVIMESNYLKGKHGSLRNKEDKKTFDLFLKSDLLENKEKALSERAIYFYYKAKITTLLYLGKYTKATDLASNFIIDFNNSRNTHYKILSLIKYVEVLMNCLINNFGDRLELKFKIENKLDHWKNNFCHFEIPDSYNTIFYVYRIGLLNEFQEHQKVHQLIEEIDETFLKKWSQVNINYTLFLIEVVKYYLTIKDYSSFLINVNYFYNLNEKIISSELIMIKFLELLSQFEQKHYMLVSQKASTLETFLRRKNIFFPEEAILLSLLKKCSNLEKFNLKKEVIQTSKKLSTFMGNDKSSNFNDKFNFINWLNNISKSL